MPAVAESHDDDDAAVDDADVADVDADADQMLVVVQGREWPSAQWTPYSAVRASTDCPSEENEAAKIDVLW